MASISPIYMSEAGPSLEEILSRHGLKPTDLDKECPGRVRDEVAVKLDDWEMTGRYLEFTLEKLRDINRENSSQELCRIALLDTWGKREGKKATYLKLASVLHRRQRCDLVEFLCAKFKSMLSLVPLSGSVANSEIPSGSDLQHQTQGESSSPEFPLDVSMKIDALEEQFSRLHKRLVNELSKGDTSVEEVLQVLTMLPLKLRREYQSRIQNMLPELEDKKLVHNLFCHLNPLFTFIDYELLQYLVSKFGSQGLKQEMTSYTEKVQLFKKVTTINELINHWPGLEAPPIDFKILRAKFADDPKSYTLEKLDSFRNRFYGKIRRSEFVTVSILMLVESASSFIAVWFIPTVAVQELTEAISQIDRTFFQTEQVLELSLGQRTLYRTNVAAECMTSSAMGPVSAFTNIENSPQQADASVDALYSLVVSVKSSGDVHEVCIDAHIHYTALKILKLQRKHEVYGDNYEQYFIKNFRFASMPSSLGSLRVIVPEENPYITAVEPEDGMIRASDIWRESEHEDLQHRLLDYHIKITMRGTEFDPPTIKFEGSTDDSVMDIHPQIDNKGDMVVKEDQIRRLQDPLSELDTDTNKNIQFGYHCAAGNNIQITNNGLGAERIDPEDVPFNGIAYGAQPLKGLAEFEVKMVTYGAQWSGSIQVGLRRCKKGVHMKSGPGIPKDSFNAENYCMWAVQRLLNNFVTPGKNFNYGYVDLKDVREGDSVGLRLSQDGVLEFTMNGESQGIAARNIYTRDTDVYAVVDHYGRCVATVITKAVTGYSAINLEDLCLERLYYINT